MGVVSPKTVADRYLHALSGCVPNLDGDVTLEPSNYIANWRMADLDCDNSPDGMTLGVPEDPEGWYVYVSEKDGGPSTLAAQNTVPLDIDEDSYHVFEDPVRGHSPRTGQFAAQIAPPDAPDVAPVASSKAGFAAGSYYVTYTWVDQLLRHTALAPSSIVTLGAGQTIRVYLPQSVPEGARYIGIWVSAPNGAVATLRLQRYWTAYGNYPESIRLGEPYKIIRSTPPANETPLPKPPAPTVKRRKMRGGSTRAGCYKARITRVNVRSGRESEPSDYSEEICISEAEALQGVAFGVEPNDPCGPYNIYVTLDGTEYRLNSSESSGRLYSRRPQGPWQRSSGSSASVLLGSSDTPTHLTSGITTNERAASSVPRSEDLSPLTPQDVTYGSSLAAPAYPGGMVEDGIEDPSSPLDNVLPEGVPIISAGTYWVALSYYVRGEETLISPPKQITITSGQTIRINLPSANNSLVNSQWRDRNSDGVPDGWTITSTGGLTGSHSISEDGLMILDTLGAKTGTATTPTMYQDVAVSRDLKYAIGGRLSAAITSGSVAVDVREFSSTNSLLRTTTLVNISASGSNVDFLRAFGSGTGALAFHTDTAYIRLIVYFAGSTRQAIAFLHELFVTPNFSGRLRRITPGIPGHGKPYDPDPKEFVRLRKSSIVGVGLPPSKPRLLPEAPPLAVQDFESSAMLGWTLRQTSVTGTTAVREGPAAISGSYGYRIAKDTYSQRYTYLYKDMGSTRTRLTINLKVRVAALPTVGIVHLVGVKAQAPSELFYDALASVALDYKGRLYLAIGAANGARDTYSSFASGIVAGDVLDIEFRVSGGNTTKGYAQAAMGKNGSPRNAFQGSQGDLYWPGFYARYAYVGHFSDYGEFVSSDSSTRYTLHFDDIILSESGIIGGLPASVPDGYPIPQPDRPYTAPVDVDVVGFDSNAIPAPWSSTRSPVDSTTAVAVETAAKIDGTHGLRTTDTGTASSATAYVSRTFSPTRTALGFRARIRVVSLPSTSNVTLMQIRTTANLTLSSITLSNTGALTVNSFDGTGALSRQTQILSGVSAGTVLTLEMVATGAGTQAATVSYWASSGGTGAIPERTLYSQHQLLDLSAVAISEVRVGITAEGSTLTTSTLHVDSIRLTEAGEVLYSETDRDGQPIYQAYFYYPPGTPQRDDLGLKDLEVAVQPNETFTVAIKARHSDVPATLPAYPYSLYAYDTAGTEYALGSLYGEGGATGTLAWTDLTQTVTIPNDCYILTMRSPKISSGEFVCQAPAITRGTAAVREIVYPESGQVWAILDTTTPDKEITLNPENKWLDVGSIVDTPTGTSAALQINSADPVIDSEGNVVLTGTEQPTSWLTDPLAVTPRRYAHFLLTLGASSDLRTTPRLATGTPYVDFYSRVAAEQVSVLLRDDLSEFSGGVYLAGVPFFRELSQFDVRQPLGQVRRHRMWDPIGDLGSFTMHAYTRQAVREIEENCLSKDFCIETRDYRLLVRFREQIEFDIENGSVRKINGLWCAEAEASISGVEVVEALPITQLVGVLKPTLGEMS